MNDFLFPGKRFPDEVAARARLAPGTARIPMPGLGVELSVLAIRYRLPAGRENAANGALLEQLVSRSVGQAINTGTERLSRPDRVRDVLRGRINTDRFRRAGRCQQYEDGSQHCSFHSLRPSNSLRGFLEPRWPVRVQAA